MNENVIAVLMYRKVIILIKMWKNWVYFALADSMVHYKLQQCGVEFVRQYH